MAHPLHDRYEKCFSRFIRELAHYRIARLVDHVHPEFDFSVKPPVRIYASARLEVWNYSLLIGLVSFLNRRIEFSGLNAKLTLHDIPQTDEYEIKVPTFSEDAEECMGDTERVICSLCSGIGDFRQKNLNKNQR